VQFYLCRENHLERGIMTKRYIVRLGAEERAELSELVADVPWPDLKNH
jgi:hypothetical protein